MTLKELREKRQQAHAFAVGLLRKGDKLNGEDRAAFDKAMAEVDTLGQDIARYERAGMPDGGYAALANNRTNPWTDEREVRKAAAFGKYLRKGPSALSDEDWSALREKRAEEEGSVIDQIGTYTGLGFFVPAGFVYDVEQATKYFAPLLDVFGRLDTSTGNPLPYPTSNDTSNKARLVAESADVTSGSTDITANHVAFAAYKYTTDLIKVSLELLQDSAFNLESWIAERMGERLGRAYEDVLTNADGNAKPTGLLTDVAASGAVAIVANGSSETSGGSETGANSVGYTDLVRLEHSVDPSYRRGAAFMFHDSTLSSLKRILDKFGRPLWVPGMKEGAPDTIIGYPYVINQSIPKIAASATTVAFGNLKKFMVRRVKGLQVQRLNERFAEAGQVAFVGFARIDSRLVDAGTHPINVLQQHS